VAQGWRTNRGGIVAAGVAVAVVLFARVAWSVPNGVIVQGALVGGLTSFLALGIALVYRANRIVNFAAGDLGIVPATLAILLTISSIGLGWWPALFVGLVAAVLLGALVEIVVIRRFTRSPRLVLTVATIGLAQLLAAGALRLPVWIVPTGRAIPTPFDVHLTISPITFRGTDVVALVAIPIVFVGLGLFLHATDAGIAIRAGAEAVERAAGLGVPVRRLQTTVWVLATVLAFVAVFLRAGIVGLPLGQVLGPAILVRALAAAVVGRMERLPTIAVASVVLGIVEQSVLWHWQEPAYVDPILFVVVLVALLVTQPRRRGRGGEASSWRAARETRPIPRELRDLPVVRTAKWVLIGTVTAVLLAVPAFLSTSKTNLAAAILIFGIIAISLVVVTGWAGQVSLGQMALAGIGAAVAGSLTARAGWDLALGLVAGGLVGAIVAVLIGLPALRRRGLTLAVTSLAFALMTSEWLLNQSFFGPGTTLDWLPPLHIARPTIFGSIAVDTEARYYYLCLAGLGLAYAMARGLRRSRSGRATIAVRENEAAAESFGISARNVTLTAFAMSGFLAAFAGGLFVHHQTGLSPGPYVPAQSLQVFAMAVIGGLGSLPGAVLGATYVQGVDYFYRGPELRFVLSGGVLLVTLMVFPGGIGAGLADLRDWWLRRVARRHGIVVPSLLADVAMPGPEAAPVPEPLPDLLDDAEPAFVRVRSVDVAYDRVQVLFGVDVEIARGQVVALLGTNGAGKSTLLRALTGLSHPTSGTVEIDGVDVTHARPETIARMGVATAPGGQGVFPSLTVGENLRVAGWTRRREPGGATAVVRAAVEHFPALADRMGDRADALSGGQQQMLSLAMALATQPRLLLVDELSLGLAPTVVAQLLGTIHALARTDTTVVVVEQSVDVALELADTAYFMEKGAVRYHGPARDLLDRPDLVRAVFLARERLAPEGTATVADSPERAEVEPAGSSAPLLRVEGVEKRFGGITALDCASFSLAPGEILGILGPNGAGKTTLFDVLSGFERADAGSVHLAVDGQDLDLTHVAPDARARLGLGRTFQDGTSFPALTVQETIAVAFERAVEVRDPVAAALNLPVVADSEAAVNRHVDEVVVMLGLEASRDKFVHELSTGTRRIVELGCIIAARPRVLLLDEPSSGIAQREAEALAPLLERIRDELRASLIVIEHDLALLRSVSTRVLALDLGRIIAEGPPQAVLDDPRVVSAYLGDTVKP
jgi:ABC-type branched-subunit amino acid transport system ATPase component/ABC-type branched-subunit amino acid transport system permease subunit